MLHNFLTPYRIPLFVELGRRFDLDLWILGNVQSIREWETHATPTVQCRFLPSWNLPTGSRDYRILINPTLSRELHADKWDACILCGWDTPASFQTAWHMKRRHIPYVLWAGSTAGESNWRRSLTRPAVHKMVQSASAWLAYGTRSFEYLLASGAIQERTFCAWNTVDTSRYLVASEMTTDDRMSFRKAQGIKSQHMLLFCGQLIARKGPDVLLDAFVQCKAQGHDISLVFIGSGPMQAELERKAKRQGILDSVRFPGFVQPEQLPEWYSAADLFVLPSREEVWGLVINEALASGTPVITTHAVGATPDLIQEGINGYAVPPDDPTSLANAILRHFTIDNRAMRIAARQSIAPFTIERTADAFYSAVQCAIEQNSGQD